jgi:hypothetical protein
VESNSTSSDPRPLWRRLLNGWLAIAAHFGAVQTMLVLAVFYVTLVGPVWLVHVLGRRDQLDKGDLWETGSAWHDSDSGGTDLERAKLSS